MLRMLRRDISCHLLVSRVQPHAVLVTIKHPPVKLPVMLLMQATMFLAQPKRARLLVLLERLVVRQVRACVLTLLQDTTCHQLVNRVRLHAVPVTIKDPPVKHPVMLLMQATMFLAQPKRARLLVLLEHTIQTLVLDGQWSFLNPLSDITFQHPARPARQLVLREPIKQALVNPRVTMLTQGITFQHRAKQARPLVQ